MDGLEWKRAKWAGPGARYYKRAEAIAACSGLPLIADAQGIADYLRAEYGRSSYLIAYGAPIICPGDERLAELDLRPAGYHLVVARMEPENHVHVIVSGYRRSGSPTPLLIVGSAAYGTDYVKSIRTAAGTSDTRFLGAIWDQELLAQLYANSRSYLHGHSVGGTNPSLLRALGAAAPVTAYDVTFNREVTAGHARFFSDAAGVAAAIQADDADVNGALERGRQGQRHAAATYRWEDIADRYESMLLEIGAPRQRVRRSAAPHQALRHGPR